MVGKRCSMVVGPAVAVSQVPRESGFVARRSSSAEIKQASRLHSESSRKSNGLPQHQMFSVGQHQAPDQCLSVSHRRDILQPETKQSSTHGRHHHEPSLLHFLLISPVSLLNSAPRSISKSGYYSPLPLIPPHRQPIGRWPRQEGCMHNRRLLFRQK